MQKLLSLTRKCIDEFDMISRHETIAVGLSGGKDSQLTLIALKELSKFHPKKFRVEAISLDMGVSGFDFSPLERLCEKIDVPLHIIKTDIYEVVFEIRKESNPCSLCAKLRRGILNESAVSLGIHKIALGHHLDDAIETFLLNQIFEGRIGTFMPVTYLDRRDVTVIRPLLYMKEEDIQKYVKKFAIEICHNPCPANKKTKREEIKTLIKKMNEEYPGYSERLFGSFSGLPLPGWEIKSKV